MDESQQSRRRFVKQSSLASIGLVGLSKFSVASLPAYAQRSITIVHTNDMHSHIEAFAADDPKYPGLGGMAERAAMIDQLRQEEGDILLLDAGDIFQGTPYFNYFGGHLELELMSSMGYDAATMGNHDFDNGMDGFISAKAKADFPFICSNYDFSDTPIAGQTIKHKVFKRQGLKIGVFGLGVELSGLVDPRLCKGVQYLDPVRIAQQHVDVLRDELKCDLVICLSHLGYGYKHEKVSDQILAQAVDGIDLIIGGHTHTFLDTPTEVLKNDGHTTYINQVGWAGVRLGVVKFTLSKDKQISGKVMGAKTVQSRG